MAARHVQPVVLGPAEGQVGAAFRQLDEADRLALRVEHRHAIEFFRLACRRAVAAPAAPQVAVAIDLEAVQRARAIGIDHLGLVGQAAVGTDVVAPDAAARRAAPFDHVELLFIRRERDAVRIEQVGDHRVQPAVGAEPVHVGGGLVGFGPFTFPFAIDAEYRVGEPDRVVGLDHDVVGRIEPFAVETVGQHGDLAVVLGTRDATSDRMLAGDQAPLAVTHIAVGVVGALAKHAEAAVGLVVLHDAVVRDVAHQQIAAGRKIRRTLGPAHAGGELLDGAAVDTVFAEARVENLYRRVGVALVGLEVERLRAGESADGSGGGAGQQLAAFGLVRIVVGLRTALAHVALPGFFW